MKSRPPKKRITTAAVLALIVSMATTSAQNPKTEIPRF